MSATTMAVHAGSHCAYCGVEFVDLAAVERWDSVVGPRPRWPEAGGTDAEWEAVDRYYERERLAGPFPSGAWRTIDHRVPRCRGGVDEPWNLTVVCSECNTRKGTLSLWAFRNEGRDDFGPPPSKLTAILRRRGPFGTGALPHQVRRFLEEIAA